MGLSVVGGVEEIRARIGRSERTRAPERAAVLPAGRAVNSIVQRMPEGIKGYLRPLAREKRFPDFIGIGAQKAGTTWLHRNLQAHPEIWMPKEKELHYFDEKIKQRGWVFSRLLGKRPTDKRWRRQLGSRFKQASKERSRQNAAWDLRYFFGRPDDGWYASLFEQGRGKVAGEATPDYAILDEEAIAHVHGLMPDAKIIFMMRNPIERPW